MANTKNVPQVNEQTQAAQQTPAEQANDTTVAVVATPVGQLQQELTVKEAVKVLAKKIGLAAGGLVALGAAAWAGHKWWPNN